MSGLGAYLPTHRYGHCGYDPNLNGSICNAPADLHVMTGDDYAAPEACLYVCLTHSRQMDRRTDILDAHQTDSTCLIPNATWNYGEPSFCGNPEEDAALIASINEVAHA